MDSCYAYAYTVKYSQKDNDRDTKERRTKIVENIFIEIDRSEAYLGHTYSFVEENRNKILTDRALIYTIRGMV